MLQRSEWQPRLGDGPGLLHERLAAAVADDIITQVIGGGARLPAHRDLAYRLKIGIGTVTKAYALLGRQGLVRSDKGRATFAVGVPQSRCELTDLSVNVPPRIADRLLAATMYELAERIDGNTFDLNPPLEGEYAHRATVAAWLSGERLKTSADELILCSGARHALAVALRTACAPDAVVLTEDLPFPEATHISRAANLRLEGIAMDAEGMDPQALEQKLRLTRPRRGGCAVYVTPTAQNPTGSCMSIARRMSIAAVCRAADVLIIEDDVYAIFGEPSLPTIRELAPERTLYVGGLSKTFTPGLRIGFLICPKWLRATALTIMTSIGSSVSPLSCLIMDRWFANGAAKHLSTRVRAEAGRRVKLAAELLDLKAAATNPALHLFLYLPPAAAVATAEQALTLGVRVTRPAATLQSGAIRGIRLCLGVPPIEQLERALRLVRSLL